MRDHSVLGLILGGGVGSRLYPLTKERAKLAVPLAGKYRLIDIPMSNCLHADINKIAILTQYNSVSLHRHIYRTYTRDVFSDGWVQILAAEQTPNSVDWYQGTADAVRKQRIEIESASADYVVILAGDHLYRMNYAAFVDYHISTGADITVAVQPVTRQEASGLGILKLDDEGRINRFVEKPSNDDELDGLESGSNPEKPFMGSMGIYVFSTKGLFDNLDSNGGNDFGKHIVPDGIESQKVMGYVFNGYWADIGTMRRFYEVNLDMAAPLPRFNLYDPRRPIYTRPRFLPATKVEGGHLDNVLLGDGCRVQRASIRNSVIGIRSIVGSDVTVQRSCLMGADYYETAEQREENRGLGRPDIGIGEGSVIEEAIIDKNARIGRRVTLRGGPDREDQETPNWVVREGIVIVPKGAIIPDGTII